MRITELFSAEAEESIIGACLIDPGAIDLIPSLTTEDFCTAKHARVFQSILALSEQNMPVDVVTVAEALRDAGDLSIVGGVAHLAELAENTVTAANVVQYADRVADYAKLRRVYASLVRGAKSCLENGASASDVVANVDNEIITELSSGAGSGVGSDACEFIPRAIESIARDQEKLGLTGAPTGIEELDYLTGGLQPGEFSILAARPSMGKTAFALQLVESMSSAGFPAVFVSLEMSETALAKRMIGRSASVSTNRLRSPLDDKQARAVALAAGKLSQLKVRIEDSVEVYSLAGIRARARRAVREMDAKVIIVDYLQLIEADRSTQRGSSTRNEDVSIQSRGLKKLSRELNVHVMALSQVNRSCETRSDKRPVMSDLRDSGSLEQDADVIFFLYRDGYYNSTEKSESGPAEIIIGKQRNGPTKTVETNWDCTRQNFGAPLIHQSFTNDTQDPEGY